MRRTLLAFLLLLATVVPAWADYQAGLSAYQRGDYATALKEWRPLAEQENADAQNNLGAMYVNGQGVTKDDTEAFKWLKRAAEKGHVGAQYSLGAMYHRGEGVPKDVAESIKWLRRAAEQGHARAQYHVSARYKNGLGVPEDVAESTKWLRRAAEQGYAHAQSSISSRYEDGEGVPKDLAEAARWTRRAAEQGHAHSQFDLGLRHRTGAGVPRDNAEALFWISLAAANGEPRAAWFQDHVEKQMNIEQIVAVDARLQKWRPTKELSPVSTAMFTVSPPRPSTASSTPVASPSDLLMAVQIQLTELGYDPGPADGVVDRKTRAAIKAFQRRSGLQVTGEVSENLLNTLTEQVVANKTRPALPIEQAPPTLVPAGVDFGRYHALVIGNNAYRTLPRLETAISDARAVAATLRDSYGFNTTLVTDATRDTILDALDGLRSRLTTIDNLLIYYAGHGHLDREVDRGYWQPIDAKADSTSRWLSNATITDALKAIHANHIMVVADSCFSGTLARSNPRGIKIEPHGPNFITQMLGKKSRTVLASGGLEPVTDSGGGDHSVFAKALLDALTDNRGVIDGVQVFARVREQVRLNAQQTPQYSNIRFAGHEMGGDFLFVRRK